MLNSFQGQSLTPIERGLDRSASGFQMLLGSIQGVATRVEQNRKLAQERAYTQAQDQLKYSRELDKIQLTKGLETAGSLAGIQARGEIELFKLGEEQKFTQNQKIADLNFRMSPQGLGLLQSENAARASGTSMGGLQERRVASFNNAQGRLLDLQKTYPSADFSGIFAGVDNNGVEIFQDNQGNRVNLNYVVGEVASRYKIADELQKTDVSYLAPDKKQTYDLTIAQLKSGAISTQEALSQIGGLTPSFEDQQILREARSTAILAGSNLQSFANRIATVSGQNSEFGAYMTKALGGKKLLTESMIVNDDRIREIMQSDARNKAELIQQHISNSYASVADYNAVTTSDDYTKFLEVNPKTKLVRNKTADDFQKAANAAAVGYRGTENAMITPFDKYSTPITSPSQLANQIMENYSRMMQNNATQVIQQAPTDRAKEEIYKNL
jgi:hypothetical protein